MAFDLSFRLDGPAVEYANGDKEWYIEYIEYSEANYNTEIAKLNNSCNGKTVTIDGKEYTLNEIK